MIIAFNCSQQTKRLMDELLASESYKDYAELIEVAVNNLSALEGEMDTRPSLVLDGGSASPARPRGPAAIQRTLSESTIGRIPELFWHEGLERRPPKLAGLPEDKHSKGSVVSIDEWLFGQYNKLLPAKASCRALAHLLLEEPHGLPLDEVASRIAKEAARLGDLLKNHDEANGLSRDERLSTAFPTSGDNVDKAKERYASQFVGYADKQGRFFGLPFGIKLINSTASDEPRILLTEAGWEFARMPNPILDATGAFSLEKLSDDERQFLLAHIARSVPVEDFAYRAILAAILQGADTPDKLDETLRQYAPAGREIRDSYVSTQRSGAVSRMADLGLLVRAREGTRVSYKIGDMGVEYAESGR